MVAISSVMSVLYHTVHRVDKTRKTLQCLCLKARSLGRKVFETLFQVCLRRLLHILILHYQREKNLYFSDSREL